MFNVDCKDKDEFIKYILEGGFPLAVKYDDPSQKKDYILSIIDEIYKKDIKFKKNIDFTINYRLI